MQVPRNEEARAGGMGSDLAALSSSSSLSMQHYYGQHRIPRSSSCDRQCLTWSRVIATNPAAIPPPRSGAASVVVKGRLYVFGGYGGGTGRLDDFYSFCFETGCWEQVEVLSAEKPGCRENNGVVISEDSSTRRSIYLFGGYSGGSWLNDLWEFDIESKRWTCIQESSDPIVVAQPQQPAAAAAANNNGQDENAVAGAGGGAAALAAGAAAVAAPVHPSARGVRGKIPSRRFGYVSVVHEGKFVLWGGFDGSRWLNDMYVFDFTTKTWTEIPAKGAVPSVRSCPAWAKDETHVYIQGGYDGVERKADFFACDLNTYTWTEMPCLGTPPSPRYFHSCCLYGDKMYLYGGYSGSERLADMYAYDFETNHWSQVDCSRGDAPSGRSSLVAQVYENSLYIFGGYNGAVVLNDFYKFRLKPIGVPPPALVNDFSRLINNPDLADVRFLVEGQDVFAHRAVLAIRSEYFRVMLCGGMRESRSTLAAATTTMRRTSSTLSSPDGVGDAMIGSAHGASAGVVDIVRSNNSSMIDQDVTASTAIELPDVSYSVFLKVLEFLYTDSVKDVSLEIGIHLLIAGEQFMLDRLKSLCEDLIRRDINVENVIGILVASHRHNAIGLKDIALEYILRHLNDPVIMTGLSDLRAEPDLLLEIIKRNTGQQQQYHQQQQPHAAVAPAAASSSSSAGTGNNNNLQDYPPVGPFGAGAEWNARR